MKRNKMLDNLHRAALRRRQARRYKRPGHARRCTPLIEQLEIRLPLNTDFGDAPDPGYPTLVASGGASHEITGLFLGITVDAEKAVGKVTEVPTRATIPVDAQEQLIVELYSK